MKKVKTLLLDLDGTLVDGDDLGLRLEFICRTVMNWNLQGQGKGRDVLKALRAFWSMKKAHDEPPNGDTIDVKMISAFAQVFQLPFDRAQKILERSVHEVFPRLSRHFYPVPGAASFVSWAREHYPLYLATNPTWNPEAVELRVKWAGLNVNYFQSFTHAQRMHSCKPRLEYYQELLDQENLDPGSCLLVGNDYQKDLPASNLGISVFLISQKGLRSKPQYEALRLAGGNGYAWRGNFSGLRSLLEEL